MVQCHLPTCSDRSKSQEKSHLAYDSHLLGMKEIQLHKKNCKNETLDDTGVKFHQSRLEKTLSPSINCCKCVDNLGLKSCLSCMSNFCTNCFSDIHSTPRMSSHTAIPNEALSSISWNNCPEHHRPIEYVSLDTGIVGCSFCTIHGEMKNSTVKQLHSVRFEVVQSGILEKCADKLQIELETYRKLQSQNHLNSFNSLKDQVESHLAMCHRMLDAAGSLVIAELKKKDEILKVEAVSRRDKIEEKMTNCEILLEAIEWLTEKENASSIDFVKVFEGVGKIKASDFEMNHWNPTISIDDSIFHIIKEHMSSALEKQDQLTCINDKSQLEENLLEAYHGVLTRIKELGDYMVGNCGKEHFSGTEEVTFSFVESPESFYLVRSKDKNLMEKLSVFLEDEWSKGVTGKVAVNDQAVVNIDEKYCRVIVIKVDPDSATVFLIDEGSTMKVSINNLVIISPSQPFSNWPALAHHCTLASPGISLHTDWRATRALHRFGGGSVCKAIVKGRDASISKSTMMVSISKVDDDGNNLSLCDYLVYYNHATRLSGVLSPSSIEVTRKFSELPEVRLGATYSVIIVEVIYPLEMCAIMLDNKCANDLLCMTRELQVEYKENSDNMKLLIPSKGMVCVARFWKDGEFYRARVIEVMNNRKIRVEYVDFGTISVVEVGDLRRIKQKFMELPAMVVKVGLAQLNPVCKGWGDEGASMCLMDLVRGKVLRMVVKRERKNGLTPKVLLFDRDGKHSSCINMRMVEKGHAYAWRRLHENSKENTILPGRPDDPHSGQSTPCYVILARSPSNIVIRKKSQKMDFFQLCRDLTTYYSTNHASKYDEKRYWAVGTGCVARVHGKGWVRAIVVKELDGGEVEVLLVDYGLKKVIGVNDLRELPDKFTGPAMSWNVHISKLVPTGGNTWTQVACEKLNEVVNSVGAEISIQVVGECEGGSWPVHMFKEEKVFSAGPLEPEFAISLSVADILQEEGLAIRPRAAVAGMESISHESPPVKQSSGMKAVDIDVNRVTWVEGKSLNKKFQWLYPALPSSCEFSCQVSHVDWDCNLHISTIPDNQENLRLIQSVLQSRYAGSSHSQEEVHWSEGEACIAKFYLDKRWYRGVVQKVFETGECLVKFVDYGSEEVCKPCDLGKDLFCTDIPIQCFTVQLNVMPVTDKWSKDVLDLVHDLVDQELDVSITEDKDTFPLSVSLYTKSGLDIAELLVQKGYAKPGKHRISLY